MVVLADAQHFPQHKPPHESQDGGAQVDGEEGQALGGGPAHTAEKSPGGAIDRQGQGVDIRVGDDAFALGPPPVAVVGDGKKDQQIPEGRQDDEVLVQHNGLSSVKLTRTKTFSPEKV